MDSTVPTAIAGLIPFIVTSLSALTITNKLTQKQKALIALAAILVVAVACELLTMTSETGNKSAWFIGTLGYVAIIMHGDLGILYNSLLSVNSTAPVNANPVTSFGTRAYVPTGAAQPAPTVPGVPPRASAPPDA